MSLKERIRRELDRLRAQAGGLLSPERVVEFASNPETALHSQFTWDDGEAAHQYRLWQARKVISVVVIERDDSAGPRIRSFVSLTTDRVPGGGYRELDDVLSDERLHRQMLDDALDDLRRVRRKYQALQSLRPVWRAMDEVDGGRSEVVRVESAAQAAV